jgi:hypothetical protein
MKEVIVSFILALVVSCVLSSLGPGYQPYPYPVGLNDVSESSFGLKRTEGNIPEVNYTDASRPTKFMTRVDEGSDNREAEWPLGANN